MSDAIEQLWWAARRARLNKTKRLERAGDALAARVEEQAKEIKRLQDIIHVHLHRGVPSEQCRMCDALRTVRPFVAQARGQVGWTYADPLGVIDAALGEGG